MKEGSKIVTLIVAISLAFSCAVLGLAQTRPPMVGGYKPISTDDAGVVEAAENALSQQAEKEGVSLTLVSVERAEVQVVAGTNYRLCLKVAVGDEDDEAGEPQDVQVVVFRSLQKTYSLKSWEDSDCSESN
jgi:hypothetical protein